MNQKLHWAAKTESAESIKGQDKLFNSGISLHNIRLKIATGHEKPQAVGQFDWLNMWSEMQP